MRTTSRREFLKIGGFSLVGLVIAACGGGAAAPAATAPAAAAAAVTLEIGSKGEELLFDKDKLEAPAGSKITLKLKNGSTALSHNWVLVKPGKTDSVATDGIAAGEAAGYLKAKDENVIANTSLVKPGETGTVTFDAPAAGQYPYICTFPGHYVLMKGTLTVK
jgi:azurin